MCPFCRTLQRLLVRNGKIAMHGRSEKFQPTGCPGSYEAPQRYDGSGNPIPGSVAGGTVVGFRAGDAGPTAHSTPAQTADEDGDRT